jgi:hypothetical protein
MQRMAQAELNREAAIARAISNPIAQASTSAGGGALASSTSPTSPRALVEARVSERGQDAISRALEQVLKSDAIARQKGQQARSSVRDLGQNWAQSLLRSGTLPSDEAEALRLDVQKESRSRASRNSLHARHQCAFEAGLTSALSAGSRSILQRSSLELQVAMYRATLAHEMGHNLGLRHNFISSFDQENWHFDSSDRSPRTYSSIMDYLTDDHTNYDGLGPQDVASLRLAYSGRIALQDGTVVSLTDYLARVGVQSVNQLDASAMAQAPIKKFMFCTDENVGDDPRCRRHDAGTTPRAIVEFLRSSVLNLYTMTHLAGDRLVYSQAGSPGFFSSRIGTYLEIRQFIDEWRKVTATSDSDFEKQLWTDAAQAADQFLHEVVRTPDVLQLGNPLAQMLALKDNTGSTLLFEPRIFDDIGFEDEAGEHLFVRGWKHDKTAALLVLMLRNYGHPRYQTAGLQGSPIEFELTSGLYGTGDQPASPTLELAQAILEDRVTPVFVKNPEAALRRSLLPMAAGQASAGSSGSLLYPIVVGGLVELDSAGSELNGNGVTDLAKAFRVAAAFRPDAGLVSVSSSGSLTPISGERRHFALAGSDIGSRLVKQVHARDEVVEFLKGSPTSNPSRLLGELMDLILIARESRTAEQTARLAELVGSLGSSVNALSDEVSQKDLRQILGVRNALLQEITAISPSSETGRGLSEQERLEAFRPILMSLIDQMDSSPILAWVWNSIDVEALGYPAMYKIDAREILAGRRAQIFRRIEILSDVLYQIHPELF